MNPKYLRFYFLKDAKILPSTDVKDVLNYFMKNLSRGLAKASTPACSPSLADKLQISYQVASLG